MAYIAQDDKQQQDGQAPDVSYPQAQPLQGGGSSADVGSGTGGAGASTAGVGAGGTGGWTNVQSYLDANKGGTGSAQALNSQVGSQFDQEKKTMGDASQGFLADSQKQVDDAKVSNEQADQAINQAAGSYNWEGNQNDDYNKTVDKMRGSLTNAYSGPTSYSYGFTAPTQQYATGLKDDGAFDGVMNQVYGKSAGKDLTRGQFDLQKQLDVNNEGLTNARQQLLQKYNGLESDRDMTVQDTTQKLGGLADQYQKNQTGLRDYLGKRSNEFDTAGTQAEIGARAEYNTALNEKTPIVNGGGFESRALAMEYAKKNPQFAESLFGLKDFGKEHATLDPNRFAGPAYGMGIAAGEGLKAAQRQLFDTNNWYVDQGAKYKDLADTEKRSFNSVSDFLNAGGTKKTAGFDVRK